MALNSQYAEERTPTDSGWETTDDCELMLSEAAYAGRVDLCQRAVENGARNFDKMHARAIEGGHMRLWSLAEALNIKKQQLAGERSEREHEDLCSIARNWIGQECAAGCGFDILCQLSDHWNRKCPSKEKNVEAK